MTRKKGVSGVNCLKCGAETQGDRVFCENCRAVMARYPIPQGTPVWIPNRPPARPFSRRRELPAEELLVRQRKKTKRLRVCVACLCAVVVLLAAALFVTLQNRTQANAAVGRNYSVAGEQTER